TIKRPNSLTQRLTMRSNSENGVESVAARPISAMLGRPMDCSTAETTASKGLDETKVNRSTSILRVNMTYPPSESSSRRVHSQTRRMHRPLSLMLDSLCKGREPKRTRRRGYVSDIIDIPCHVPKDYRCNSATPSWVAPWSVASGH